MSGPSFFLSVLLVLFAGAVQESEAWFNQQPFASFRSSTTTTDSRLSYVNQPNDMEYPWKFTGRCIFRAALVRLEESKIPEQVFVPNLFGWTVGGTVVLEYDESPVGPYHEFVKLGGVGLQLHPIGGLMVGQYGANLYVDKPKAQVLCESVWNLKAEPAVIKLVGDEAEEGERISIQESEENAFEVSGWGRLVGQSGIDFSQLSLLWTPSIKAIWASIPPILKNSNNDESSLPLHRLRLSGSARLDWCNEKSTDSRIPIGFDICVDQLLIEISQQLLE